MAQEQLRSEVHFGELNERAAAAASALLHRTTSPVAPDLRHFSIARRLSLTASLAGLGLVVGAVLFVSLAASGALPWIVGTVLALAVVGVIALGAHAGGHGWFVPLPVLVLATVWAVMVSAGHWASPTAWVLAVVAFGSAVLAAVLMVPAIALRHAFAPPRGPLALVGAEGVALSALAPTGVARVNNETWTAESLSGPLPPGAPVHVARVEGLRLLVWSEAGSVPGPDALGLTNQEKEQQ